MPSFAYPWLLLLLPLAPLVAWWRLRRAQPAVRFSDVRLLDGLPAGRGPLVRRLDAALHGLAALSLVLALAGPRLPRPTPIKFEGIALMLAVDVSGSMHEIDIDWDGTRVSRLDAATRVFELFVQGGPGPGGHVFPGRPQDLMGLVTFASYPDTAAPLTLTHSVLLQLLKLEQTRPPEEGQTNIGDAIAEALVRLEAAEGRRKVIVLLSDGEHNYPGPATAPTWMPRTAAQRAADLGVIIHTVDTGDDSSANHEARVDGKETMKQVAQMTGGTYFSARDTQALLDVYQQIDRLERRPIDSFRYRRYRELHLFFGLAAFGLLFAGRLMHSTVGRRLP
jgi:Ca-activated chloride channel family protein